MTDINLAIDTFVNEKFKDSVDNELLSNPSLNAQQEAQ